MDDDHAAAEIQALLERHADAIRSKDVDAAVAVYAPEVVAFDLAPPLQNVGTAVLAKVGLEDWFATWDGRIGIETRGGKLAVSGELAFAHAFVKISGTKVGGQHTSVWTRATTCLRKIDGAWKIVHEHMSVPFYMDGSFRAAVDLEP